MKINVIADHDNVLSELREQIIKGIEAFIPNHGDKVKFKVSTRHGDEEIFKDHYRFQYYGSRYKGYSDRYNCELEDLNTDDLSEILTALESID